MHDVSHTPTFTFGELFAGAAGLSTAISRLSVSGWNVATQSPKDIWSSDWDLSNDDHFDAALRSVPSWNWLHGAPPCGTFSKARRTDEHGSVAELRSPWRPAGYGDPRAEEANVLARRQAALAKVVFEAKGYFSIENPFSSYLWQLKEYVDLAKLPGVRLVRLDQCAFGCRFMKPTGILTNAPWLWDPSAARRCEGALPHSHEVLAGRAWDYRVVPPEEVWLTSLAAEYPAAMCELWAESLGRWLTQSRPAPATPQVQTTADPIHGVPMQAAPDSKRVVREQENQECVGGLRNPNKACAKNKQLRVIGARVRMCLETMLAERPHMVKVTETLGQEQGHRFSDDDINAVRAAMSTVLQIPPYSPGNCQYWADAIEAIVKGAGDPDTVLPEWVRSGFPIGIEHEIVNTGVFPAVSEDSAAVEASRAFGLVADANPVPLEEHCNYKSYYDEEADAEADLLRTIAAGYAERIDTTEELVARFGNTKVAKIGVVVKIRKDMTKKIRLIVDMLRAGVNGLIKLRERVVLPRVSDAVDSALDLSESLQAAAGLGANNWMAPQVAKSKNADMIGEFMVVDFEDAFYTLKLRPEERKYVVASGTNFWVAYNSVAFGLACGPLLWGRLAAFAGRSGQALFAPDELRLQIYVDDPIAAVIGKSTHVRSRRLTILLLYWAALGFRLAWKKGQRGSRVEWVGAELEWDCTDLNEPIVRVSAMEDKTTQIREAVDKIQETQGMTSIKKALTLAGKAAWIGSLIPRARPFVSMLWGAITKAQNQAPPAKTTTRRRPKGMMFVLQVAPAARVLKEVLGSAKRLTREYTLRFRHGGVRWRIRTDASPYGLGGYIMNEHNQVAAYWADKLTPEDLSRFDATIGDPAFQAEWELLAVLISLHVFANELCSAWGCFAVQSDSKAALGTAMKLASPRPSMNAIAAEIAIQLEVLHAEVIIGEHVSGTLNFVADALSRLSSGKELPKSLHDCPRRAAPVRGAGFYKAWVAK